MKPKVKNLTIVGIHLRRSMMGGDQALCQRQFVHGITLSPNLEKVTCPRCRFIIGLDNVGVEQDGTMPG